MKLTVFPNPVTDGQVNMKLDNALTGQETAGLELRDLNGRLIIRQTLNGGQTMQLNLKKHNLKPGVYIISLQNGANVTHQKIILQ